MPFADSKLLTASKEYLLSDNVDRQWFSTLEARRTNKVRNNPLAAHHTFGPL
jgi:hypothetical protein